MLHARYPGYDEHKKLHFELIENLSVEQYKLLHAESQGQIEESIGFLREWFINHTSGVDRDFADYLKGREGSSN